MLDTTYGELFKTIKQIENLGGSVGCPVGRVYPVIIPKAERNWPVCVIAKSGGQDLGTDFEYGAIIPVVTILVVDDDYIRLNETMEEIILRINIKKLSYSLLDPPNDFYYETLDVYAQSINVSLQQ